MATLFSLPSSSSAFLSSLKNSPNQSTFPRNKQTLHFKTPLSVHSLLSAESDPPPLAIQTFWQWLSSEGIISSKSPVKPGIVPEGLGLVAQRNIARNEVVLEVPKKFWINPDTVSGSVIGSVCGGLKPWVSVALFLIREKKLGDDSKWRYYIDILPEYTDSTIYCAGQKRSSLRFKAVQYTHSFSMQSFQNREKLTDMKREFSALHKINKSLQARMKKLEDQAEAATKAQTLAEERVDAAKAIKKVAEAEKKEAEDKRAQAKKELQEALATKDAEIREANEKGYAQGMADVTEEYKLQVRQACNRGFSLGWMSLAKRLNVPDDSPLRKADAIPLPFPPPPPPSQTVDEDESESEAEDQDNLDDDALVRRPKDANETKSPPQGDQVLDLTQEEEIEEGSKEADMGKLSSDLLLAERSLDKTLAEIDAEVSAEKAAEVAAEKDAEVVLPESSEVPAQPSVDVEES